MNLPAKLFDPEAALFGSSRTQKRVEDERLLTGKGLYSDDRALPRMAWLVLVRSPHARAGIVSVDLAAARAAPGVIAAWTFEDLQEQGVKPIPALALAFKRPDGSPIASPALTLLADGEARHVGQAVAAIVAERREQAQDAAELVAVEYSELPAVVGAKRAAEPGAPELWPAAAGNLSAEQRYGDAAATDAAFARAARVTSLELYNQRINVFALEPRCSIAESGEGRITLYTQNQMPTGARAALAAILGGKAEDYRIVVGNIGGGFGMKAGVAPEDALVCFAARKLGRPVKWRSDRSEEFLAAPMGRDTHFQAQLALDEKGSILGLRVQSFANLGAFLAGGNALIPLLVGPKVFTSVYKIPTVDFRLQCYLSSVTPTGAYRGAGRPEANYLMERLIGKAAREMGRDPVDMRRRNLLQPGDFPHRTALGDVYDTGDFPRILDRVLEAADWSGFGARRKDAERRGRLCGRGLALYIEWTSTQSTETVDIRIAGDGTVTVFSGTQAMGQGLETSYAQLVAEIMQIPVANIRVVQGDTDQVNGGGSGGSRSGVVGGSAAVVAGRKAVERGKELAGDALEAAASDIDYRGGVFSIAGTDRAIAFSELAARQPERFIRVSANASPSAPSWPNGAQVCEVEIDPETGVVRLTRVASVDDVGRIVNHMIVEGQIQGGIAQGVGQALLEQAVYDPDTGQLLAGSLMDYAVPRADDFPAMRNSFDESIPCQTNLLGMKGCGELGTIGATPAVVDAVLDALAGFGVTHLEMPLTPQKIWRAMREARLSS
jgi:carbon-monoxide dehydrogenase large subunit